MPTPLAQLTGDDDFVARHIGPTDAELERMLDVIGAKSLDDLLDQTVPASIRIDDAARPARPHARRPRCSPPCASSPTATRPRTSLIGMGYTGTLTPPVIQRNVLEDPAWYTAYTPVPAGDQPGPAGGAAQLPDDGQRADRAARSPTPRCSTRRPPPPRRWRWPAGWPRPTRHRFVVHHDTHPQTIAVLATRAEPIGIELVVGDVDDARRRLLRRAVQPADVDRRGRRLARRRSSGSTRPAALAVVATDLLACVLDDAARRSSAPTSPSARRSASACRWGSAARTPRSSPPTSSAARALPGRHRRRQHRHRRPAGAAARPADPRAAHPPREGDVQHLHGAGAAGQHRRVLRRVARSGRAARGSPSACTG